MIVRSVITIGSDFEHSGVRITWVIPFKTRLNWDIPGYPSLSFSPVQGYPVISHLVPSYPLKRYPRISRDIPRQDSCLGISNYKFSVLGYPGLSLDKHQFGISPVVVFPDDAGVKTTSPGNRNRARPWARARRPAGTRAYFSA